MKVSRRRMLQVLPAAAAVPASAQESPARPEDEQAKQRVRQSAQIVRQVQLPMATEPAFKFLPKN